MAIRLEKSFASLLLRVLALGQFAALALLIEHPAKAYVDPGSGLLVFQMFGASIAGGLFVVRRKLRALLDIKSLEPLDPQPQQETSLPACHPEETTAG